MLDVTEAAVRACKGLVVWVCAGVQRDGVYWPGPEGLAWEWYRRGHHLWRPAAWTKNGMLGGDKQGLRNNWEYMLVFKREGRLPWADPKAAGAPPKYKRGGAFRSRKRDGSREPGTAAYPKVERANPGNVLHVTVGGGHLGSPLAHLNEAPYPEGVPEFWVRCYCPPGGLVLDPFSGSGTTGAVALKCGRRAVLCDNRSDQVELTRRRLLEAEGLKEEHR
jgi:site-specific DNA-methyltransferase (cytosine-N4-specific)